jgi:hypothetical protein
MSKNQEGEGIAKAMDWPAYMCFYPLICSGYFLKK